MIKNAIRSTKNTCFQSRKKQTILKYASKEDYRQHKLRSLLSTIQVANANPKESVPRRNLTRIFSWQLKECTAGRVLRKKSGSCSTLLLLQPLMCTASSGFFAKACTSTFRMLMKEHPSRTTGFVMGLIILSRPFIPHVKTWLNLVFYYLLKILTWTFIKNIKYRKYI